MSLPPFELSDLRKEDVLSNVEEVIRTEAYALAHLSCRITDTYFDAIRMLLACRGKVILTGVGKSGLIARKIASTLSSTGTTAAFLHPSDGMHGDLGVISSQDVVIALGKSGESDELVGLLPALRTLGAQVIAITTNPTSTLARNATVVLHAPVEREACPLDLAPTVSTTVALAIGDALAMTLMKLKNFNSEDFARYHPGGQLGKRLLLKVKDLMIPAARCPILDPRSARVEDVIGALGEFGLGIVLFSYDEISLAGVLTDGDIRRLLSRHRAEIFEMPIEEALNRNPLTISSEKRAVEALRFMEDHQPPLNVLPIVEEGKILGVARLHELLKVS